MKIERAAPLQARHREVPLLRLATLALALTALVACDKEPVDTVDACAVFEFVADGGECASCSLSCECEDDYPVSIATCTPDGCIVDANCEEVCAADLTDAVDCSGDSYSVE